MGLTVWVSYNGLSDVKLVLVGQLGIHVRQYVYLTTQIES